jgi:hypothetical protein
MSFFYILVKAIKPGQTQNGGHPTKPREENKRDKKD